MAVVVPEDIPELAENNPIKIDLQPEVVTAPPISGADLTEVKTMFGIVSVQKITDGRLALRHEKNEELKAHLALVVEGRGHWQPTLSQLAHRKE